MAPEHLAACDGCGTPERSRAMLRPLLPVVLVLVAPLLDPRPLPAQMLIPGGGAAKGRCHGGWLAPAPNHGKTAIDCQDGDPGCDLDRLTNGVCAVAVGACLHLDGIADCSPRQIQRATVKAMPKRLGKNVAVPRPVPPPTPVTATTCGSDTVVTLPLRLTKKAAQKPSKRVTLQLATTAAGKPKHAKDTLKLRCVPNAGAGTCGPNPAGGPSELRLTTAASGSDLDLGWTGNAHGLAIVPNAAVRVCLAGCDATTTPACGERETETGAVNPTTLGAPLPLVAADVPICVVNRFGAPALTGFAADVASGAVTGTINLSADLYRTSLTRVCPRCSAAAIGDTGVCDSGARQGRACVAAAVVQAPGAGGDPAYAVSSDCPPSGLPVSSLPLTIPVTSGVATLAGPRPCGATQDDACGGTCDAACTGDACASVVGGRCQDARGGVSQVCCASDPSHPCFPTASGTPIVRLGEAIAPAPPFGDPTYPKIGGLTLASAFCAQGSSVPLIDALIGLPGPATLVMPAAAAWLR
jgi:hypothetical protein